MTIDSAFSSLCCAYVAVMLAAAAIGKGADLDGFSESIGSYFTLGKRAARIGATALIGTEGVTAVLLLRGGDSPVVGACLAAGLLIALSVFLADVLVRRPGISCNCFGPSGRPISRYDLARNAILLGACGSIIAQPPTLPSGAVNLVQLMGLGFLLFLVTTNLDLLAPQTRQ